MNPSWSVTALDHERGDPGPRLAEALETLKAMRSEATLSTRSRQLMVEARIEARTFQDAMNRATSILGALGVTPTLFEARIAR